MEIKINNFCNIGKVKSSYILDIILKFLSENKKLELISYNKKIQEKLKINIENFKNICQRQIIFETIGKAKEYLKNTNILIFEGEYKNSKRNGKGCEYDFNKHLRIEGEYSNGKIINGKVYDIRDNMVLSLEKGKGKEYYDNGRVQFEGEYLKGRRWNGKGYDYLGNYIFEIKNGKGKGKEYNYLATLTFEGEYFNGLKNGKGKEYDDNGNLLFEGEYLNGKKISGKGYDYEGHIVLLLEKGKGKEYYDDGKIQFEGDYLD